MPWAIGPASAGCRSCLARLRVASSTLAPVGSYSGELNAASFHGDGDTWRAVHDLCWPRGGEYPVW
eukprot:1294338-Amphidinium_carterae.1